MLNLHLVLTQSLNQAVRWGILASNPAKGAQPPRPRRPELAVVDVDLAGQILEKIKGTPVELPAAIAIATGMRRGEILGLRWGDLDAGFSTAQVRRSLQVTPAGLIFEEPKTHPLCARRRYNLAVAEDVFPELRWLRCRHKRR